MAAPANVNEKTHLRSSRICARFSRWDARLVTTTLFPHVTAVERKMADRSLGAKVAHAERATGKNVLLRDWFALEEN